MMTNANRDYFRKIYPNQWLANWQIRLNDEAHYKYQEITLDHLDCFSGCSLLECGCGSGELLHRLAQRYSDIRLFGADLGQESLRSAMRGPLSNFNPYLMEGDVGKLPISSNSFDRILVSSVLWYIPEPRAAIREMIRVLKPGGRFVFDVRTPYHITNVLARWSLTARRAAGKVAPYYSFLSPSSLNNILLALPVQFEVTGYFVLLPTRLPLLGREKGNWVSYSDFLSFRAGQGNGRWLAQKLLVTGNKLLG